MLLVDDLQNLKSIKGWRIEVVFDGAGRSTMEPLGLGLGGFHVTPLDQESKKSMTSRHGMCTIFISTGMGIKADLYIEA